MFSSTRTLSHFVCLGIVIEVNYGDTLCINVAVILISIALNCVLLWIDA